MGDGLTLKSVDERDIRRVDFEPKEQTEYENVVVYKPKNPEKEMLRGSVVWFVSTEEKGKCRDVLCKQRMACLALNRLNFSHTSPSSKA